MKKVIDAGALRSPNLHSYLSASPINYAVVTDYTSMESFKGDAEINIRRSLEILSKFSKQVIVLRSTSEISRLRPRSTGIHQRFKDERQTKEFAYYCNVVLSQASDLKYVTSDIQLKQLKARTQFENLMASTETIRKGIFLSQKAINPKI